MGITIHFTHKAIPIQTIEVSNEVIPEIKTDVGPEAGSEVVVEEKVAPIEKPQRKPRVKKVKVVKLKTKKSKK